MHKNLVNAAVQTEGWSSHNKKIKTEEVFYHKIDTQTEGKSKDFLSRNDLIILKLREEMMQAHLSLEQHQKQTVSLQKQLRELALAKNEAFEKARQEEEKMNRMKTKLKNVRNQLETICSLYSNILTY